MIAGAFVGRLGADGELKDAGGTQVLSLRVAVSEREKVNGTWQDATSWVDVSLFGKRAEGLARFATKGTTVFVRGAIKGRAYTSRQTGEAKVAFECRADDVQLVSPGKGHTGGDQSRGQTIGSRGGPQDQPYSALDDDNPF